MSETKTFYVTKYSLSSGQPDKCEGCEVYDGRYATRTRGHERLFARIGTDAFESEQDAKANVVDKAKRKLKSLEKQRKNLESIIVANTTPVQGDEHQERRGT